MKETTMIKVTIWICLLFFISGCMGISPVETGMPLSGEVPEKVTVDEGAFLPARPGAAYDFATAETIRGLSARKNRGYRLGPGDTLDILVWNRPEISRKNVVVAPDGLISVPRVGQVNVTGMGLGEVEEIITTRLARNYETPEVSVSIREFNNNKAFVLGRVVKPGVVNFPGEGTLLEALALAGGLPHIGKETFLTRCAIIRGSETVIWVDLRDLLDYGNMSLNARIMNNDVIFIPEAEDETVFIMGEIEKPGPIHLRRGLTIVDAVMRAGGYTDHADLEKIFVLRPDNGKGRIKRVNLKRMLETGDMEENYALRDSDIVYVGPRGMRRFNYALEQILPTLKVLSFTGAFLEILGGESE